MQVSTEDKGWWCNHGEKLEKEFVFLAGSQFTMNPDKTHDKYTHDLIYKGKPADLKSVRTPFFTAGKYGYDPNRTVTFNLKDLHRYQKNYPDITVIFWAVWPAQERFGVSVDSVDGVWGYSLDDIRKGDTAVHSYQRRREDKSGNAKESMLLELRDSNLLDLS